MRAVPDGKGLPKLSLTYTSGQADFDKVAATLQQMWKQNLGVTCRCKAEEQGKFNDDLTAMANDPSSSDRSMLHQRLGRGLSRPAELPDPAVAHRRGQQQRPLEQPGLRPADRPGRYRARPRPSACPCYNQAEQIAIDQVGWLPLYNGKGSILDPPGGQRPDLHRPGPFADDWTQGHVTSNDLCGVVVTSNCCRPPSRHGLAHPPLTTMGLSSRRGLSLLRAVQPDVLTFLVGQLAPGNPVQQMMGNRHDPERYAATDAPVRIGPAAALQYVNYMGGLLHGDLGLVYQFPGARLRDPGRGAARVVQAGAGALRSAWSSA